MKDVAPVESQPARGMPNVGNFLAHHDTHPLTLAAALTSTLGPEWVLWLPDTLRHELEKSFNRSEISTLNWDKIQAVRTCLTVASPWQNASVFGLVAQPLNNNLVDFATAIRTTPAQCCNAVRIMKELGDWDYSDDVAKWIAASFLHEGIIYLPEPVDFAQKWASEPRFRCKNCGWTGDNIDNSARVCWSCNSRDLNYFSERDEVPAKKRYDTIVSEIETTGGDHDLLRDDDAADVQTAKLLVVRDYMAHRERQLREQVRKLNVSTVPSRTHRR